MRKLHESGTGVHLAFSLLLMAGFAAGGCDALKTTPSVSGSSSTSSGGSGTTNPTAGGTTASPTPVPSSQSFTIGLATPPGSAPTANAQSPYFSFSNRSTGTTGDFRFIQPAGNAALEITTVGASNGGGIADMGAIGIDDNAALPSARDTLVQMTTSHVYGITLVNTNQSYGRILVTAQTAGTVTFSYRFPIER